MTVIEGQTVDLTCPITNAHQTSVEWKNPEGHILFFVHKKGEDDISSTLIRQANLKAVTQMY